MNCNLLHTKGASANKLLTMSEDRKSHGEGATSIFNTKGTTVNELLFKTNNIKTNYTKNSKKKVLSVGTKSRIVIKARNSVVKPKFTKKGDWGAHTRDPAQHTSR